MVTLSVWRGKKGKTADMAIALLARGPRRSLRSGGGYQGEVCRTLTKVICMPLCGIEKSVKFVKLAMRSILLTRQRPARRR